MMASIFCVFAVLGAQGAPPSELTAPPQKDGHPLILKLIGFSTNPPILTFVLFGAMLCGGGVLVSCVPIPEGKTAPKSLSFLKFPKPDLIVAIWSMQLRLERLQQANIVMPPEAGDLRSLLAQSRYYLKNNEVGAALSVIRYAKRLICRHGNAVNVMELCDD
jgi:hypothetical protein